MVEIEDWNEYGELKQHVKIVGTANLVTPALGYQKPGASTAPKAPAAVQATKQSSAGAPAPKEEKKEEPTVVDQMTSAMSGLAMEAAQKAKELKKAAAGAATTVLTGTGANPAASFVADTPETTTQKAEAPAPLKIEKADSAEKQAAQHNTHAFSSIQSPTSTAWKPTDVDPPIMRHRGSEVKPLTAEEVREIEASLAIKEEEGESSADEEDRKEIMGDAKKEGEVVGEDAAGVELLVKEKPVAI